MSRVSWCGRATFSKCGNPISIQFTAFRGASFFRWGGGQAKTTAGNRDATFPLELGNLVTETTSGRSEGRVAGRRGCRTCCRGKWIAALLKSGYALF